MSLSGFWAGRGLFCAGPAGPAVPLADPEFLYNFASIFQIGENKILPLFFLSFDISRTVTTFFLLFTKNSYTPHNPSLFFWYKISELPASCIQSKKQSFPPIMQKFYLSAEKNIEKHLVKTRGICYTCFVRNSAGAGRVPSRHRQGVSTQSKQPVSGRQGDGKESCKT